VTRFAAAMVVAALSVAGYPATLIVDLGIHQGKPTVLPGWLHVEHPTGGLPYISDDQGRQVLLHGAIPAGLIDFWSGADPTVLTPPPRYPIDPAAYDGKCPVNTALIRTPPLCRNDIDEMKGLGFDSVRLPVSWSLLEPERGKVDARYLDRIAQVVSWAKQDGLWVVIDMHQNAYSRYTGRPSSPPLPYGKTPHLWDHSGAPPWATITDGFPAEDYGGQRELDPAVLEADANFWYDRNGIQEEYISAIARLAARFKDEPAVAGYSIFNEPWPGWSLPPAFEDLLLFPFYRRVIDAVTGVHDGIHCSARLLFLSICGARDAGVHDSRHLFFLDTGLDREVTDFPTHLGLPVSSYPNLVLSIHAYTHVYTFDALAGQKADSAVYPPGGYDFSYATAEKEAKAIGAALFVAEFGSDPGLDPMLLTSQLKEQEKHRVGFAFWTWKENCGNGWGMYAPVVSGGCAYDQASARPDTGAKPENGCLRQSRERLLARVYPVAAPPGYSYGYDPASGAFTMTGDGDPTRVRLIVPSEVTAAPVTTRLAGDRYRIDLPAAPLKLKGCA
jgi:endoglycosylceramidase